MYLNISRQNEKAGGGTEQKAGGGGQNRAHQNLWESDKTDDVYAGIDRNKNLTGTGTGTGTEIFNRNRNRNRN